MNSSGQKTFEEGYCAYWQHRVESNADGSKVAAEDIIRPYVALMNIEPGDRILDLGCGYGRLYPILAGFSSTLVGLDISSDMLDEASKLPYACLIKGSSEQTHLARGSVDHVVTWATFDVVEQEQALGEANRILRGGGKLLITGKNVRYHADDEQAFIAERNAKLKEFPNHFTEVKVLLEQADRFGFSVQNAFGFERRGDFGEGRARDLLSEDVPAFYEYLLILKRIGEVPGVTGPICTEFSQVATEKAKAHGFSDVRAFFVDHKASE